MNGSFMHVLSVWIRSGCPEFSMTSVSFVSPGQLMELPAASSPPLNLRNPPVPLQLAQEVSED